MKPTEINPALIGIKVVTIYLPSHSRPENDQYTFAYTISITNAADVAVQLLSRHWIITDADNSVEEVRGDGVVGEQPIIKPGGSFRYTSGATLPTPVGCMEGEYIFIALHEATTQPSELLAFEVTIPAFTLHTPTSLN